ncbi:putative transcription factor interactor and regulator CCHC(Zn) family [Helianthus annuus]|nr:putative transcription factor interactor and regulator CCHC(Zn) family [Helianthus annuus]
MMVSLLQQAVKEEILILLQHNGSAHSIWKELRSKFVGSKEMIKNKMSLLKKEFDLFRGLTTKNTKQIIERYCNLVMNMKRLNITKDNEEWIEKLADALPQDVWGTYLMMLKNKPEFDNLTLSTFIEQLEAQEMEQRKIARMKDFDGEQDIGLYYKGGISDKTNSSPKIETAFNAKSSSRGSSQGSNNKTGFSSYPSFDPNFSAIKNGKVLQCNIALNLENGQNFSEEVAKGHMSLLVTVLESYESLVAGRIGNPMLTKEDYDQIDDEEMELMDIKWCLASVLRRAEKFKQITGRDDFRDANVYTLGFDKSKVICFRCREKGHFKRECTNREASGAQNPFGNNDYYRKAIYHQVAQQPYQQQSPQISHAKKEMIEESSSKRACFGLIDQDDERLPEGFSWDKYCPDKNFLKPKAFVAQIFNDSTAEEVKRVSRNAPIIEDSDDDYYASRMKEHLRFLAERDNYDDANVRGTQKKVTKQDDSDDDTLYYARRMKEYEKLRAEKDESDMENARVIKKQVKEIPTFEIEKKADAEKVSEKCENCESMKKHNNELIYNMNRLKESYDVLNKAMNQYNESSSEQATAMKTLNGAYMTK